MGLLQPYSDLTGTMTPLEVNQQNIRQLIDELNRNSDQLDTVTNNLNYISRGSAVINTPNPAGTVSLSVSQSHGLDFPPVVLATYRLAGDSSGRQYQIPNYILDDSGSFVYYSTFVATSDTITFRIIGAPPQDTFTFSYYLLRQPANLTLVST